MLVSYVVFLLVLIGTMQIRKLEVLGQNIRKIWIKPDEMILQAEKDKSLLDRKQKIREFLNCRRKVNLRRCMMNIQHVGVRHRDDGT